MMLRDTYKIFPAEIACLQDMACVMRPPCLSFCLAEKKDSAAWNRLTDCHASDVGHWLAMTGILFGFFCSCEPRAGTGDSPCQKYHGASAVCVVSIHAALRKRRSGFCPWAPLLCEESRGHFLWSPFFGIQEPFLSAKGKKWVLTCAGRSRRTLKYLEIDL